MSIYDSEDYYRIIRILINFISFLEGNFGLSIVWQAMEEVMILMKEMVLLYHTSGEGIGAKRYGFGFRISVLFRKKEMVIMTEGV